MASPYRNPHDMPPPKREKPSITDLVIALGEATGWGDLLVIKMSRQENNTRNADDELVRCGTFSYNVSTTICGNEQAIAGHGPELEIALYDMLMNAQTCHDTSISWHKIRQNKAIEVIKEFMSIFEPPRKR